MQNAINWFEIPATNIERAVKFYSQILGTELRRDEFMGVPHGFFPADQQGAGGAIVQRADYQPSDKGVVIYLNAGRDLDGVLSRIESAGGKVLLPKTDIGNPGHIAILRDTEGNTVGLHSPAV